MGVFEQSKDQSIMPGTYTFPKTGGGEITKTLARPTNKRWTDFLSFMGLKKASELRSQQGGFEFGVRTLDVGGDPEQLTRIMDICLAEGSSDVDFGGDFDLTLSDEVVQDFFGQRSKRFFERAKS